MATVACVALPGPASAQAPVPGYPDSIFAYDPREVAMLPRYCIHTQLFRDHVPGGNNPEQISRWTTAMGTTFIHMHHYCYGLMDLNRATILARDAQARRFYLDNAVREFDYVLERAPADFVLLPEILTKKGETFVRQGRAPLAIEQFERAIEIKPDYWPPYAHLSDYYRDAGDLGKARELLDRGLAAAPDAKGLQRRLAELQTVATKRKGGSAASGKQ
jgi:tetratricopeptide (TPR) repeat protein